MEHLHNIKGTDQLIHDLPEEYSIVPFGETFYNLSMKRHLTMESGKIFIM